MSPYSEITIHYQFSSLVQKEKYLLSYNGQYYEARLCETGGRTATAREGRSDEKVAYVYPCLK